MKFVVVTGKLLTGFDAPILQVMYLDKPMRDHNLLQAVCQVNRTFNQTKTHGLIVDYIGIFDDVAKALVFDEKAVRQVVGNIEIARETVEAENRTDPKEDKNLALQSDEQATNHDGTWTAIEAPVETPEGASAEGVEEASDELPAGSINTDD